MFLKRPPSLFFENSLLKVDATAQQAVLKDPMNIQVEVLDFEADATAEQVFLKRPPNFFGGKESSKSRRNCATGIFKETL